MNGTTIKSITRSLSSSLKRCVDSTLNNSNSSKLLNNLRTNTLSHTPSATPSSTSSLSTIIPSSSTSTSSSSSSIYRTMSKGKRASLGLGILLAPSSFLLQCDNSDNETTNTTNNNTTTTNINTTNNNNNSTPSSPSPTIIKRSLNISNLNDTYRNQQQQDFHFESGVCIVPHPQKRHKGGEDAYFVSEDHKVLGVADGVGGWAEVGVDPSEYSRSLMEGARLSADSTTSPHDRDPVEIMQDAYRFSSSIKGSSTCCIVLLDGSYLSCANLGDSGFMVVRGSDIIYRSKEQQHSFNFPYQLGTGSYDLPEHSDKSNIPVQEGDLLVMGSDGLWDNLYDDEIVEVVLKSAGDPVKMAQIIARRAYLVGNSKSILSPFARAAQEAGYIFTLGGKLDDISVLVARVSANRTTSSPTLSYDIAPSSPSSPPSSPSSTSDNESDSNSGSDDDMDHEPTTPSKMAHL
eukprot:TRINITY_DN3842_c0_g1_i1.p1 TRINITY_DN3842_c0_g1~~TRINITY_DN3842_c0_g1_i1.p1  ORF type:complete len:461 (-),score=104.20 TRINITY_DN3842_c0_g1_i1:583-1965(-)